MLRQAGLFLDENNPLYDSLVPKDHILRQIKELVDFSFVYEELKVKYCNDNGRNAVNPFLLFKYLLLKAIYCVSDVDVVKRSLYDLSFKYFLNLDPKETNLIDPSLLTVFRRKRLEDDNLLDLLIGKTVEIAASHGLLKTKAIIVDSTHTNSRYNSRSPREALIEQAKRLRKSVYNVDESKRDKMPAKINSGVLEDHIDYCNKLVTVIKNDETLISIPNIVEQVNLLEEMVSDNTAELKLSYDHDAKVGHKTYDTHFFGYKTHIAMTEDRIITAAVVTTGEKHDGKQLISLIEKTQSAGMEVNEVIGDGAYSESDNLVYGKQNNITIVAKLSKCVTHGSGHNSEEFEYNKDADMYVCKDGHMAIRKAKGNVKAKGRLYPYTSYFFDTEKCKRCPHKDGCYTEGAKSKTYTVSHKQGNQLEQKEFMESDYFKERSKIRYMIEAKNSELKNGHDMSTTYTAGLLGMNIQVATTIFVVNLKRIIALKR